MKKAIACLLALPLALTACGARTEPAEPPAATPAPTPAVTAPAEEPAASAPAASPETTPAPEEPAPAPAENTAQQADLAAYTQTLGRFFHTPVQSTKDIPPDYSLSFFLLYQTFESNGGSAAYTQNDNYFWEIPESNLLQTADLYLGLADLSLSEITEWPFGEPQNGVCYYTQETSLPYGDVTVTQVTLDAAASEALVYAEVGDTQFEESTRQSSTLVYHFTCINGPDGSPAYRLESITAA